MIKHEIFPTLLGEFSFAEREAFKTVFFDRYHHHSDGLGQSNEGTGHVDIHHDTNFSGFFGWVGECILDYLDALSVGRTTHDVYFVKSWLMPSEKWTVPMHSHADAHVSYVYYVNIPPSIPITRLFFNSDVPNELYHKIFEQNATSVNEYNRINYGVKPEEGKLVVFPSKTRHFTAFTTRGAQPSEDVHSLETVKDKRICLAGDVVLTYKRQAAKHYGLMPVSNWRELGSFGRPDGDVT